MVTLTRPQRLTLPAGLTSPPVAALAAGGVVAFAFLIMPAGLLERLVTASGIAAVVAAAEPPLGITARIALALLIGGGVAAFTWLALSVALDGEGQGPGIGGFFRREDVHPDAPPRPPLFAARDLGTPFLDVKAPAGPLAEVSEQPDERALPVDFDQPMAAFDPQAIRDVPLPPPEPVAPLARTALIDPGDRIETFELTPVARPDLRSLRVAPAVVEAEAEPEPAMIGPDTAATVHDLLARLERGLAKPAPPPRSPLENTLGELRRMATGAG